MLAEDYLTLAMSKSNLMSQKQLLCNFDVSCYFVPERLCCRSLCCAHVNSSAFPHLPLPSTYSQSMTICPSVCLSVTCLSACLPACGLLRSCRGQSCWRYAPGKMRWRASVAFISLENAPRCLSLCRGVCRVPDMCISSTAHKT